MSGNLKLYITLVSNGKNLPCLFLQWLPNHKGLVNGIVVAGFGGGAFIFNQVQTAYINPHNKVPDQPAEPGSSEKLVTCKKRGIWGSLFG